MAEVSAPLDRPPAAARHTALAAAFAAAVALLAHARALDGGFLSLDDADYVTENPLVRRGLTGPGFAWAWNVGHAANWHPLTWLSHMADVSLFGFNARGHHATSLLLHALCAALAAVLIEALLARGCRDVATSRRGFAFASGLAAAFWAAHPWRVESVAWVAERKDVLSGALGLAALLAYVHYADRPSVARHATVTALLGLGLCAKPMLVSLPAVFLVLDAWPLRRPPLRRRILEKVPWALLAAASCALTLVAQKRGGALASTAVLPLGRRIGNALVSYARYAAGLVWPGRSSVLYPYPAHGWPAAIVGISAVLVVAATVAALALRRRAPWWGAGLAWFAIMTLPVAGLVQAGIQARADRYTYLPHLGLVLAVTAAIVGACRIAWVRVAAPLAGIALIVLACAASRAYERDWKDTETLLTQALAVTRDNAYAHFVLALDLDQRYRYREAEAHAREAVRLDPSLWVAWDALAHALAVQGRYDEAMEASRESFRVHPGDAWSYVTRGTILLLSHRPAEAVPVLEQATTADPLLARGWTGLADARAQTGQPAAAAEAYRKALALDSDQFEAWIGLGILLAKTGDDAAAVPALDAAERLVPSDARPFLWRAAIALRRSDLAAARREEAALRSRNPEMADAVAADIAAASHGPGTRP